MPATAAARSTAGTPGNGRDLGRVGEQIVLGEKLRAELTKAINQLEARVTPVLALPKPTNGAGHQAASTHQATDNIAARIERGNIELQALIAAVQDIAARVDL
jgi:hypothetical protein